MLYCIACTCMCVFPSPIQGSSYKRNLLCNQHHVIHDVVDSLQQRSETFMINCRNGNSSCIYFITSHLNIFLFSRLQVTLLLNTDPSLLGCTLCLPPHLHPLWHHPLCPLLWVFHLPLRPQTQHRRIIASPRLQYFKYDIICYSYFFF